MIQLDGNEVTVCIWDTAGQEKFFSLTKSYFKKADGVLIVFDLTDKISFDRNELYIKELINSGSPKSRKNQIKIAHKYSSAINAI